MCTTAQKNHHQGREMSTSRGLLARVEARGTAFRGRAGVLVVFWWFAFVVFLLMGRLTPALELVIATRTWQQYTGIYVFHCRAGQSLPCCSLPGRCYHAIQGWTEVWNFLGFFGLRKAKERYVHNTSAKNNNKCIWGRSEK
ncbi:unnamed protein product [Laminaria digitata]